MSGSRPITGGSNASSIGTHVTGANTPAPLESATGSNASGPTGSLFPASAGDEVSKRDLTIFTAMLSGQIAVKDGMRSIALSGGWPIRTANGYLFARPGEGEEELSLIGDHNGWQAAPMEKKGDLFWTHAPVLSPEGTLRYKFSAGPGRDFADPWARRYLYEGDLEQGDREISFIRTHQPHLERWPLVSDGSFDPRTIQVWVPKGPIERILYVHDGQNQFRPRATPFGAWSTDKAVGPRTMVVGIEANLDPLKRALEYTDTKNWLYTRSTGWQEAGGDGEKYAAFCHNTVVDFIESRYANPKKRGIMGSSLGGVAAYLQSRQDPSAYDFVACLSSTFGFGGLEVEGLKEGTKDTSEIRKSTSIPLVDRMTEHQFGEQRPVYYFYSGGHPGGADNYDATLKAAQTIAAKPGYGWDTNVFHAHAPGVPHGEVGWRALLAREQTQKNPIRIFEAL